MKLYEGRRKRSIVIVTVDGQLLDPQFNLRNHGPVSFDWGYGGSGPAQLALAILAHHLEADDEALNLYQRFKWAVIAEMPRKRWSLTSRDIDKALQIIHEQESLAEGALYTFAVKRLTSEDRT